MDEKLKEFVDGRFDIIWTAGDGPEYEAGGGWGEIHDLDSGKDLSLEDFAQAVADFWEKQMLDGDAGEDYEAIKYTIENQTRGQTALAALARLSAKAKLGEARNKTCFWQDDEDGVWETECGNAWIFEAGGPQENKVKFCPFCGFPLVLDNQLAALDKTEIIVQLVSEPLPKKGEKDGEAE